MAIPNLARLIYLAAELQPELPKRELLKLVPQTELVASICKRGITGAASDLDIPVSQIQLMYDKGRGAGTSSLPEFRTLLGQIMLGEADIRRDQVTMGTYLGYVRDITNYIENDTGAIIAHEVVDLGEFSENSLDVQAVPKFDSGFLPLDFVTGGLYQSITTMIARPGHGKTSIMISIMEAIRASSAASSIWYYEQEIPKPMMLYRISPAATRTAFLKGQDRLICGQIPITDIEAEVHDHPDMDRILIIDSPDVMAGGTGENKRFAIEDIYLGLIRLKSKCKAILVTSWPRRKDKEITLESGAEAWAKAWYSDIIFGASKLGACGHGFNNVRFNVVKNRFGPSETELTWHYNYSDLTWNVPDGNIKESQEDNF